MILDFERAYLERTPLLRERAIRRVFGLSPITYETRLNQILAHPAVMRLDPALVRTLLRKRDRRRDLRRPVAAPAGPVVVQSAPVRQGRLA